MIRVFVVDDSAFARRATTRVLAADPAVRIVGEAASGAEALARIPEAAARRRHARPRHAGHERTRRAALAARARPGAPGGDALRTHPGRRRGYARGARGRRRATSSTSRATGLMDLEGFGRELRERVQAVARERRMGRWASADGREPDVRHRRTGAGSPPRPSAHLPIDLCVLGASTGGPAAIQTVLEQLPADFPVPIAIVQHMPPGFTRPFAVRLDAHCRLKVSEAEDGERLGDGTGRDRAGGPPSHVHSRSRARALTPSRPTRGTSRA